MKKHLIQVHPYEYQRYVVDKQLESKCQGEDFHRFLTEFLSYLSILDETLGLEKIKIDKENEKEEVVAQNTEDEKERLKQFEIETPEQNKIETDLEGYSSL